MEQEPEEIVRDEPLNSDNIEGAVIADIAEKRRQKLEDAKEEEDESPEEEGLVSGTIVGLSVSPTPNKDKKLEDILEMYSPHSVEVTVDTGNNTVNEWYDWETESNGEISAKDIAYWFTGTTNVSELLGETVTLRKSGGELEFHLPADVKSRATHGYFHLCQLGLRTKLATITENNKVAWSNKAKAMVTSLIGFPLLYFATIFPSLLPEQYSGTVDSIPELALFVFWIFCGMFGVLLVVYSAFNISVFILQTVARLIQDINEVER